MVKALPECHGGRQTPDAAARDLLLARPCGALTRVTVVLLLWPPLRVRAGLHSDTSMPPHISFCLPAVGSSPHDPSARSPSSPSHLRNRNGIAPSPSIFVTGGVRRSAFQSPRSCLIPRCAAVPRRGERVANVVLGFFGQQRTSPSRKRRVERGRSYTQDSYTSGPLHRDVL